MAISTEKDNKPGQQQKGKSQGGNTIQGLNPGQKEGLGAKENSENKSGMEHKSVENFVADKRVELEQYASETLQMIQDKISKGVENTVNELVGKLDNGLSRSGVRIKDFVGELGDSVQTSFKKIEARPVLPVVVALVGGTIIGIFIGSRTGGIDFGRIKNELSDRVAGRIGRHSNPNVRSAA